MHLRARAIFLQRSVVVARRAFPGVAIRESARCEIHLKKCLNQADFSAIIGLPNAHFVNLFVGDSRMARFSGQQSSRWQDDLELDCVVEVPHEESSETQTTRSPAVSANKTRVNRTNVLTSCVSLKPTEGTYDARYQRHRDATARDEPYHYRGA